MKVQHSDVKVILGLLLMIVFAFGVYGASIPTAPLSLTRGASSSFNASNIPVKQTDAVAGNITALTLNGITQTRAWQGYYGNITGTITLDDAANYTFYNWTNTEPRGMIYASLVTAGTPSWPDVDCMVFANNATNFHTQYNILTDDYDNVTQTYTQTNHVDFQIIERTVTGCPTTYIYRDDASQTPDFQNFLLIDSTEGGTDGWVFGTIIENNETSNQTDLSCYNGESCDFQLLVAEDGHGTDVAVTAYYFWVDIIG